LGTIATELCCDATLSSAALKYGLKISTVAGKVAGKVAAIKLNIYGNLIKG